MNKVSRLPVMFLALQVVTDMSRALQHKSGVSLLSDASLHYSNLTQLLAVVRQYTSLCIYVDDKEIVDIFVELFMKEGIPAIVKDFNSKTEASKDKICNSIVIHVLSEFSERPIENIKQTVLYVTVDVLNYSIVSALETFFLPQDCGQVLVFSVRDGLMYRFSKCSTGFRHLIRSSVSDVLQVIKTAPKSDFPGRSATVAVMNYPPFLIIQNGNVTETFSGMEVMLVNELSSLLNLCLQFKVYDNWGILSSNGTWQKGVAQSMLEGKADLAVANIWQIPSLYRVMDFGPVLTQIRVAFLVPRPQEVAYHWESIICILQPTIWFATLAAFVAVLISYHGFVHWDPRLNDKSWTSSAIQLFGLLTMSSAHRRASDGNSRYILTAWSVFSLLLATTLSTGIVTRLTLPLYSARIDTVRQLVEGGFYWTVNYYVRFKSNFELKSSFFDLKDEWQALFEKRYKFMDPDQVQDTLGHDQKVTFMVHIQHYGDDLLVVNNLQLLGHVSTSEFRVTKDSVATRFITIGVKKGSPLLEPLNRMVLKILEAGLLHYWKNTVIRSWPVYDTGKLMVENEIILLKDPHPLQLSKTKPIFYLLLSGLTISLVVFCLELVL